MKDASFSLSLASVHPPCAHYSADAIGLPALNGVMRERDPSEMAAGVAARCVLEGYCRNVVRSNRPAVRRDGAVGDRSGPRSDRVTLVT